MSESENNPDKIKVLIPYILKEINRLHEQLIGAKSESVQQPEVLIAIATQITAHGSMLAILLNGETSENIEKHAKQSEKLTQQTDQLIIESVNLSRLTRVLIWLTVVLGLFAVIQIVLMVYDIWKHK